MLCYMKLFLNLPAGAVARQSPRWMLLPAALFALSACESEANPTAPVDPGTALTLNEVRTVGPFNATSTDTLVYLSLASGTLVPASGTWDVALRRYEVRLNSPAVAGAASRNVTGYAVAENRAASNDAVLAMTTAGTLAAFDAIRTTQIPADSLFVGDILAENTTAYLNFSGVPTANATRYWKVRTANGGFALVRVSAISFTPQFAVASLTLETRVQSGTTLGAAQTITVAAPTAPVAISLVTAGAVTASGCNWDLRFDPASTALTLVVNTGCNVATSPGPASPTFAAATSASDAAQYVPYLSVLSGPIPNSVTDLLAPFRYNLASTQRLHPAFNSYLVKSGAVVYKAQFINYYNETGSSGYITVRYARIR
jgi:hypothetical protein